MFEQSAPVPGAPLAAAPSAGVTDLSAARLIAERIRARMRYDVMGRDDVIELVLIALLGDGHVLLEDHPGSGKTTLAKALGLSIVNPREGALPTFRRVQFTPDMLPGDITGVMIFDTSTNSFHFRPGPVFTHCLLVDEINRTSPKVQSALLECMAEKQVTVDNESRPLDQLFFVLATQNPLDSVGTYPLPLAQLDRFLFKIKMAHIARDAELEVLASWGKPRQACALPTVTRDDVINARAVLREQVVVDPAVHRCLVDIAQALRDDKRCIQGVSTRSLVLAIPALQTRAMLHGRDFVAPDDIEALAPNVFQHRLSLVPGAGDAAAIVRDCLRGPIEALSRGSLRR